MKGIYKGFSSENYHRIKSFKLNDLNLVKQDLLNHIFTRKSERIKMPTFGTRIPDMEFEGLTEETLEIIRSDIETVFRYDPRVEIISLSVVPLFGENSVLVIAELKYIELNMVDKMDVTIDLRA